jgi:preprotein translocase subunit YajC
MFSSFLCLAQAGTQQSPIFPIGMMVIVMVAMFWMTSRSQKKREQERKSMLDALKKGDQIFFAGGILGRVEQVGEKTLVVKIADNVKVEVHRTAVNGLIDKEPEPAQASA